MQVLPLEDLVFPSVMGSGFKNQLRTGKWVKNHDFLLQWLISAIRFFFFPTQILNFISIIYLKICSFLTALQATSVMWQVSVCAGLLGGSLFCFINLYVCPYANSVLSSNSRTWSISPFISLFKIVFLSYVLDILL